MVHDNRWYDKHPVLAQAVGSMRVCPDPLQTVLGDATCTLAEREFQALTLMTDLKSLGSDKILILHKSMQKKRSEDSNLSLHKALNAFAILSQAQRLILAHRIIVLTDQIAEYLRFCKASVHSPTWEEIETVVRIYVECFPEEAEKYMDMFRNKLLGTSPDHRHDEEILDRSAGMRMRSHQAYPE